MLEVYFILVLRNEGNTANFWRENLLDLLKTCQFGLVVYFSPPELFTVGCLNNRGLIPGNDVKNFLLQTRFWGPRSYIFQLVMAVRSLGVKAVSSLNLLLSIAEVKNKYICKYKICNYQSKHNKNDCIMF